MLLFGNERITIRRTMGEEDLHYVVAAERDEINRPYITPWSFEKHRQALDDVDMLHLIVEDLNGGRVGFAILLGTGVTHGTVELVRIVITDKGKGYGKETLQAIQRFAFHELKARRLWLDVKERNMRARRLYKALGFRVEGTMRDVCRAEGGYESLLIMSLLAHEYEPGTNEQVPRPEEALDTLRRMGIVPASGVLLPRMAGKTDGRVYAIAVDGLPRFILKYDEPNYNRNATAFLREYSGRGWLPEVWFIDPQYRYFLYDYVAGQPGAAAASVPKSEWMGQLVKSVVNQYRPEPTSQGWGWLDDTLSATWADFLERRIGEARRRIGSALPLEDHIALMQIVDAKHEQDEPAAYLLHGDCGAHNFLFGAEGLLGLIDPSPMIGPPIYDVLFAFCSTPDDLAADALEASRRELDPRLLPGGARLGVQLAADMLLALYSRIATCMKYGTDATEYLRAWEHWKLQAGLQLIK
jgi:RimJ/RimL family protein N-acetyltransferase